MSFFSKFINLFLTIAPILIIIVISTLVISFAAGCTTKKEIIKEEIILDPNQNDGNNGNKVPCGSLAISGLNEKNTPKSIKIAIENDIVHIKVLENSLSPDKSETDKILYDYEKYYKDENDPPSLVKKIFKASIACHKKTGLIIAHPSLKKANESDPKSLIKYFIEKEDNIKKYDGSATLFIDPERGPGKLFSIWGSKIDKTESFLDAIDVLDVFVPTTKVIENDGFPIIKLPWITSSDDDLATMHEKAELINIPSSLDIKNHIKISFVCESKFTKFNKNTITARDKDKNPTFDDGHRMICYLITSHDFKKKGTWAKEVIKKSQNANKNANSIDFNIRWFNMNEEEPANFLLGKQNKDDFDTAKIAEITEETLKPMTDKYIDGSKKIRISIVDMATFGQTDFVPKVKDLTFSACFLKKIAQNDMRVPKSLSLLFQESFKECEGLVSDEKKIDFPTLKKELKLAWPTDLSYSDLDFCMNSIGKSNICKKYRPTNIALSDDHIKFQQCFLKDLKEDTHKNYKELKERYNTCIENNVDELRLGISYLNTSYKNTCSLTSFLLAPTTECFSFSDYEFCNLFQNDKTTCHLLKNKVEQITNNFIDDKFSVCYAILLTQGPLLRTLANPVYTSETTDEENYNFCKNLDASEYNSTKLKKKIDEIIGNNLCLKKNECPLENLKSNSAYTICETITKLDANLECDKSPSDKDLDLIAKNKKQSEFETCYIDYFINTTSYKLDEQEFVACKTLSDGTVLANSDIDFAKLKENFAIDCKNEPDCHASTTERFVDVRHFCELVTNFLDDPKTCEDYAKIPNEKERLTTLETWEKSTYTDCFNTYLVDESNSFLNDYTIPLNPPSGAAPPVGNNDFLEKFNECRALPIFKNLDSNSKLDFAYTYTEFDKKCTKDRFCDRDHDITNKYYFCTLLNTAFGHSSSEILNTCKNHDPGDLFLTQSKTKLKECYLEKIYPSDKEDTESKFQTCRESANISFLDNTAVDFEALQTSFKQKCLNDPTNCPDDYNDQNKLDFCLHTTELTDKNDENISFCKNKFDNDGSLWGAYVAKKLNKDRQDCVVEVSAAATKSWAATSLKQNISNGCNGKSPYDTILDTDFFTGMAQKIKDKSAKELSYAWPPNLKYNDYDVCMEVFENKKECDRYILPDVDAIAKETSNERIRSKYLVLKGWDFPKFTVKPENTRDFMMSNHKTYLNWCEIKKDADKDECQKNTLEHMSDLQDKMKDLLPKGALFKEISSFIAMDEGDISTLTPSSNNPGEQPLEIVDTTNGNLEIKITSDANTNISTIKIKKSSIVASNGNPVIMSGGVPVFSVSVPANNPTKNGLIWAKESSKSDYSYNWMRVSWILKEDSKVNGFEDMHFEGHNIYDDENPFLLKRIFDDDDEVSNSVWAFTKRNSARILFLHGIIHPADKDYKNGVFLKCLSPEITAFSIESLEKTADYYSYNPQQQTTEDSANPKLTDGASSMECFIHSTIDGSDIEKWTVNYKDEIPYEKRMITDLTAENNSYSKQFCENSKNPVYLDMAFGAITTDQRIYDWSVQIQQGLSEDELTLLKTQHNHHFQKVRVEIVDDFRQTNDVAADDVAADCHIE